MGVDSGLAATGRGDGAIELAVEHAFMTMEPGGAGKPATSIRRVDRGTPRGLISRARRKTSRTMPDEVVRHASIHGGYPEQPSFLLRHEGVNREDPR